MIAFGANFISHENVKRRMQKKTMVDYQAAFVEIYPNNPADLECLRRTNSLWYGGTTFAEDIYLEAKDAMMYPKYSNASKFFALTKQLQDYLHLIPEDILGLMHIVKSADNLSKIEFLQVEPSNCAKSSNPQFRYIGSAILTALKKFLNNSDFLVHSVNNARIFYEKNNFEPINFSNSLRYFAKK